jgi:hypothetical protein
VTKDGGDLVICHPSPWVYRVLEIMGLHTWVTEWDPDWSDDAAAKQKTETSRTEFTSSSRHTPARCDGMNA